MNIEVFTNANTGTSQEYEIIADTPTTKFVYDASGLFGESHIDIAITFDSGKSWRTVKKITELGIGTFVVPYHKFRCSIQGGIDSSITLKLEGNHIVAFSEK